MTTETIDWMAIGYITLPKMTCSATAVDTNAAFRELRFQSTAKTDNLKPSPLQKGKAQVNFSNFYVKLRRCKLSMDATDINNVLKK